VSDISAADDYATRRRATKWPSTCQCGTPVSGDRECATCAVAARRRSSRHVDEVQRIEVQAEENEDAEAADFLYSRGWRRSGSAGTRWRHLTTGMPASTKTALNQEANADREETSGD
jgi:hypothetical protein